MDTTGSSTAGLGLLLSLLLLVLTTAAGASVCLSQLQRLLGEGSLLLRLVRRCLRESHRARLHRLRHRVSLRPEAELEGVTPDAVLEGILATVPAPR